MNEKEKLFDKKIFKQPIVHNKCFYSTGFLFKNCVINDTKTKPPIIVPKITQEYSIAILIIKHLKFLFLFS